MIAPDATEETLGAPRIPGIVSEGGWWARRARILGPNNQGPTKTTQTRRDESTANEVTNAEIFFFDKKRHTKRKNTSVLLFIDEQREGIESTGKSKRKRTNRLNGSKTLRPEGFGRRNTKAKGMK
jgi:hypothetical protein